MRSRAALLVSACALALGLGVGSATATAGHPSATAKTCSAGYVRANLSWGVKCLRAGEFCKVGNREYLRYGFVCPASGHLRRG